MMETVWAFLGDAQNQKTIGFLGGGAVVVLGGIWAVIKYLHPQAKAAPEKTGSAKVEARNGGVAIGGSNSGKITTNRTNSSRK